MNIAQMLYKLRTMFAVLVALSLGGLLIAFTGRNPFPAFEVLLRETFTDYYGFANMLTKASPIMLAGLAVLIPLRAGFYNIGGEGQIYLGALGATIVALHIPDCPPAIGIPLVLLASAVGGALWALIPALLKIYRGVNEVIVTLLMNFIGIQVVSYAVSGPLIAAGAPYPYSDEIAETLRVPTILAGTGAHAGIIFALALCFLIAFIFRYTTFGFGLTAVGLGQSTARYAGLSMNKYLLSAMLCGGAAAGIAGGLEVIAVKYRLYHLFSGGYGYDGIVAAFMASGSAVLLTIFSMFLAALKSGAGAMQRSSGVERSIVDAIQGLIVICVAASLMMKRENFTGLMYFWKRSNQSERQNGLDLAVEPLTQPGEKD